MVAKWKKDLVSSLAKKAKSKKVVGLVKIDGIPSKQMQSMRKKLKGEVDIIVSRSSIIQRGLDKAGIEGMRDYLKGPTGVVLTDLNPFQLEKLLYGNKTNAPAKPGSVAPFDLVIEEGDTGLPAGPVIGDLQSAGVKAKIQGGKIVVTEESLLVKQGERVNEKAASVLSRLGVEPMEIALKLSAAYEDGTVYPGDILHIQESETIARVGDAYGRAYNLAYNSGIINKATIEHFILDVVNRSRNLMINAKIVNKETVGIYLAEADAQAKALKAVLPDELAAEAAKLEEKPAREENQEKEKTEKEKPAREENQEKEKTEKEKPAREEGKD